MGAVEMKDVIRVYISSAGVRCNSIKLNFGSRQQFHGSHVKRRFLPPDVLEAMDAGEMFTIIVYIIFNLEIVLHKYTVLVLKTVVQCLWICYGFKSVFLLFFSIFNHRESSSWKFL